MRNLLWYFRGDLPHHIHLFEYGDPAIQRHLAFKDYLLQHADVALGYSWIKRCLAKQFPYDIEAYVYGKDSFIRAIEYRAGVARKDQLIAADCIVLEPYQTRWEKLALAEINAIKQAASLPFVAIEHLGSTAVVGLSAKPIIDIFIALATIEEGNDWIGPLKALGYVDWPENPDPTHARFFKGMPPFGIRRTHHIHIMPMGDEFKQRIAFRDLLCQQVNLRNSYQALKQKLANQYLEDREAYTKSKVSFINKALSGLS